jgi:hypothetical protein
MQVKVRNLDHREYVEEWRGKELRIPGNGEIEMGRSEAIAFLGQATALNIDGAGRCLKPKMLKIVEDPERHAAHRDQPFRAEFTAPDGTQFRTKVGFEEYMAKLRSEVKEVEDAKPVRRRRTVNTASAQAEST